MFVFFKHQTAYEMRMSDWSSDGCSSDLCRGHALTWAGRDDRRAPHFQTSSFCRSESIMKIRNSLKSLKDRHRDNRVIRRRGRTYVINKTNRRFRSEEHTSELQSLLRVSYAVFFLKKNKHTTKPQEIR